MRPRWPRSGCRPPTSTSISTSSPAASAKGSSIARAIITRPKLIVADEPVSALDVSIRAQILDLFAELSDRLGISFLFISHDLTVVRAITDDVLVMKDGKIVERGPTAAVFAEPSSAAARALVGAAPDLHRAIARRLGEQG